MFDAPRRCAVGPSIAHFNNFTGPNGMKIATAATAAAVLFAAASASADLIASTSFENEADLGFYDNDLADGTLVSGTGETVVLLNSGAGVADDGTVNSTASSVTAGDLGFSASWVDTRGDVGLSDGDFVGVTTFTGSGVGSYPDGVQGYQISDSDGLFRLTFSPVDVSAFTDVEVSFQYFLADTGYESDDSFAASVVTDAGTFDILSFGETDLEANVGSFRTASVMLPDTANLASLVIEFDSNSGVEALFLDDVQFNGVSTVIPEPTALAGLGLLGLVGLRRRR